MRVPGKIYGAEERWNGKKLHLRHDHNNKKSDATA